MKLNPISMPVFGARISRDKYPQKQEGTFVPKYVEVTKEQWAQSYQDAVDKIRKQEQRAIELDSFMRSSDMQKEIEKLPEEGEVVISSLFNLERFTDTRLYNGMHLSYDFGQIQRFAQNKGEEISNEKTRELAYCYVQDEDGTINKDRIVDWVKNLQNFFGVNK